MSITSDPHGKALPPPPLLTLQRRRWHHCSGILSLKVPYFPHRTMSLLQYLKVREVNRKSCLREQVLSPSFWRSWRSGGRACRRQSIFKIYPPTPATSQLETVSIHLHNFFWRAFAEISLLVALALVWDKQIPLLLKLSHELGAGKKQVLDRPLSKCWLGSDVGKWLV